MQTKISVRTILGNSPMYKGRLVQNLIVDIHQHRNLWKYLQQVTKDAMELTEYVSKNQEAATNLLKMPPDKV